MKKVLVFLFCIVAGSCYGQPVSFTIADTLRGMLTPARSCYDVTYYNLNLKFDLGRKTITGSNTITYKVMENFDSMQIDLSPMLVIDTIIYKNTMLKYRRIAGAVFVKMSEVQQKGTNGNIIVYYRGRPNSAKKPPWDGGFIWSKDVNGKPWVGVACQGTGASCWWPCKDHQSDEPDSMQMSFTIPSELICISNGRLAAKTKNDNNTTTWKWKTHYPINNYDVTFNIADYGYFKDYYISGKDTLTLDYYVLKGNVEQAREQFKQVKIMLACFEKYFGPYPFIKDGYKLVETSYWGMEHQSCISYGNAYQNNKEGFDYIIIHESAHEWWGNSITAADNADMWIHESFATYAEALYVECRNDYKASIDYLISERWEIEDKRPIIGPYNVNYEGSKYDDDMYFKGAWMIHTFRSVLNNDTLFFRLLKSIQRKYALKQINSSMLIYYINEVCGKDYSSFFKQYLNTTDPPVLEYKLKKKGKHMLLYYRWKLMGIDLNMPVEIKIGNEIVRINPIINWQNIELKYFDKKLFDVNRDRFYVKKEEVKKVNKKEWRVILTDAYPSKSVK